MVLSDDPGLDTLKKRYPGLHPLIFHRSVEKSVDFSNLFEILESIPPDYPIAWDDNIRAWVHMDEILLKK